MTRKFPWLLTVAVIAGVVIGVALGLWQLQRREWKETLLARIEAARVATPEPVEILLGRLALGDDVGFTRVVANCPGIARAPYVELYAIQDGQAGSRIISACRLSAAPFASILVDRGFVAETISSRPPVRLNDETPATVTGVVRVPDPKSPFTPDNNPGGRDWYWRDLNAMAVTLDAAPTAPVFLAAESSTNPEWRALHAIPVPSGLSNNHLGYALTWFGLAAAMAGVYVAVLIQRLRRPPS